LNEGGKKYLEQFSSPFYQKSGQHNLKGKENIPVANHYNTLHSVSDS